MPIDRHSTTIDGDRYEMTLLGATQGYRLFHRLFQMFGPSLGKLLDAASSAGNIQDVDLASEGVVDLFRALTTDVREQDLDYLIESLKKQTHVSPGDTEKTVPMTGVFELHFSGKMGAMFRWLAWGLKVQYQSFFDVFASMKPPEKAGPPPAGNGPTP